MILSEGTSLIFDGQPFTLADAHILGLSREAVRMLVRTGRLRHAVRGVYLDARAPDDLTTRARCVALRLPAGAAVSRRTAAWLMGVDGRAPGERDDWLAVECTVPLGHEPISRPGVRCYVAPLAGDVEHREGLACTTPERTAIDLLRWSQPHMGLAVVDALAARGLVDPARLVVAVERFRGAPGVARARYLAALVEPLTESFGESWLRLRILDAGFPRPTAQIRVVDAGGRVVYRLDLGWEDIRRAVEYDGEEFHSSPEHRRHDDARRRLLDDVYGWRVLGVGRGEVLGRSVALEAAVGELLGREPRILRRTW